MAIIQDIPVDVWLEICRNLSLKSLCRLQAVCKGFRPIVNNRAVWLSALIDLMTLKHSACSREDVEKMSASELRDEAARILRVDRAFRSPKLPHQKVATPIEFGPSERIDVALLPRGERLLVIRKYGDLAIYDIATGVEIVSCLHPENANLSEASHTDLYGLYPTSSHNGYIAVIATDHDADHGPEWEAESVISRELRVYKYSLHGLSHVLTDQQDPFDTGLCLHLSREEGTTSIRITRLYLPDPSNKRLIAVSTQTVDEGGHKEKETVHFWRSDHIPNESDCSLELLSPDFVLIRSERREGHGAMLLIDLARASKSTEPPAPLHPVDSGEIDSPWWLVGKCVVDNTSRRNPLLCSVRVLLLTPKRLYVLHITRTTSVGVTHMTLGFLPITTLLTVPEALVRMHGGLNHGLICMQRPPRRRPRRDPLEGEKYTRAGLWSYTIDYPQAQGNRIKSPGNMRLESTSRNFAPQILIGDRNEIIEAQSMEFRVDPVSGRFVQFAGLPSRRSAEQGMRKVDLYVLGDEMV